MAKRIDHQQVRCARLHGLPNQLIAERLECSERQVRRINADLKGESISHLAGTDLEYMLWIDLKKVNKYSGRRIAWCFCMSHEHVRQILMRHINQFKVESKEAA